MLASTRHAARRPRANTLSELSSSRSSSWRLGRLRDEPTTSLFAPAPASSGYFVADSPAIAPRGIHPARGRFELETRLLVIRDPATGGSRWTARWWRSGSRCPRRRHRHSRRISSASRCRPPSRNGDATPYPHRFCATAALGDSPAARQVALQRTAARGSPRSARRPLPHREQRTRVRRATRRSCGVIAGTSAGLRRARGCRLRFRGPSRFGDPRRR